MEPGIRNYRWIKDILYIRSRDKAFRDHQPRTKMDFADVLINSCLCGFGMTFASRFANSVYNKISNKIRNRKNHNPPAANVPYVPPVSYVVDQPSVALYPPPPPAYQDTLRYKHHGWFTLTRALDVNKKKMLKNKWRSSAALRFVKENHLHTRYFPETIWTTVFFWK